MIQPLLSSGTYAHSRTLGQLCVKLSYCRLKCEQTRYSHSLIVSLEHSQCSQYHCTSQRAYATAHTHTHTHTHALGHTYNSICRHSYEYVFFHLHRNVVAIFEKFGGTISFTQVLIPFISRHLDIEPPGTLNDILRRKIPVPSPQYGWTLDPLKLQSLSL